jgi:gas vesicle protein
MSELDTLERDVAQARARFADDLARLRSPDNLARFKDDLWAEARETKDELVDKTKEAAKEGAQRVLTELKERAAGNPLAAAAIGAGLAWRFIHRPPIATLLIGAGLFGLLRTSAPQRRSEPYMGFYDEELALRHRTGHGDLAQRAADMAGTVKEKVQDWSASAGETARAAAAQIADKAAAAAEGASQTLQEAHTTARETVGQATENAAALAQRASTRLQDAMPDREDRDKYLLGVAALAVAAAVGIAYQRRTHGAGS